MLEQGILLLTRFCQDARIRIRQPHRNLQIKVLKHLSPTADFVALYRWHRGSRRKTLFAGVENEFESIP